MSKRISFTPGANMYEFLLSESILTGMSLSSLINFYLYIGAGTYKAFQDNPSILNKELFNYVNSCQSSFNNG